VASVTPREGQELGKGLLLGRLSEGDLANDEALVDAARGLTAAYINQGPLLKAPYFDLAS
jgi:hypothetical protein